MPQSNEIQRNYLQATNQSVKKAIARPLSFKDELTQNQKEAVKASITEVKTTFRSMRELIADLSAIEKDGCLVIACTLVETGGNDSSPVWQLFLQKDPQRAEELFPIIRELQKQIGDLVKKDINFIEYELILDEENNKT